MENERSSFRAARSSHQDDPFRDSGSGSFPAADEGDSIFSVSHTSGPKTPASAPAADFQAEEAPGHGGTSFDAGVLPSEGGETVLQPIEDPVLESLAAAGVFRHEQMALVEMQLRGLPAGTAPWRAALSVPDFPHDAILQTAARMHGVPAVDLDTAPGAMLLTTLMSLPPYFLQACDELRLLPFGFDLDMEQGGLTLKLASSDPMRPEVGSLLEALETPVRLYYASGAQLEETVRHLAAYEYQAQA